MADNDRGGLDYKIVLKSDFEDLISFKNQVASAKEEVRALKKEIAAVKAPLSASADLTKLKNRTLDLTTANKKLKNEKRELVRAIRDEKKANKEAGADAITADRTRAAKEQSKRDGEAQALRERKQKEFFRKQEKLERANHRLRVRLAKEHFKKLEAQRKLADRRRELAQSKFARQQARLGVIDSKTRARRATAALADIEKVEAAEKKSSERRASLLLADDIRAGKEQSRKQAQDLTARQRQDPAFLAKQRLEQQLLNQKTKEYEKYLAQNDKRYRSLTQSQNAFRLGGQRLLFTFRRLFGVLAIFTAARLGAQFLSGFITGAIKFNGVLEQAQLGIAGLINAVGDFSTDKGLEFFDKAEGLAEAFVIAREQNELLRRDALKTAATYEDLVRTFQVAVAPGLTAGLNVDEIRELTIDISQAASALQVPQNQLSEEIRSLLSGAITARNTRIATALGISPADIKRVKELGTLADFLSERFAAFGVLGEQILDTFEARVNNAKAAVDLLFAASSKDAFKSIKDFLLEIQNTATTQDADGIIKVNPDAQAAIGYVFDSMSRIVDAAKLFVASFEAEEFGPILKAVGILVELVVYGLLVGLRAVIPLISAIAVGFNLLADISKFIITRFATSIGSLLGYTGSLEDTLEV